ncbi:MAG: sigma-70 family RNA polymerase sigma factor [Pseudomonadota bacterium]
MSASQKKLHEAAIRRDEKMLLRWLTKKLGDADAAKDVAQTVFMRIWAYAETETIENPRALIFKTASNLALNELKRRNRFNRRHIAPYDPEEGDPLKYVASPAPSPETEAEMRDDMALTLRAIRDLPDRSRRAFMMNRFDGLSYKQIASEMGVSESSVEKYMIEALKRLREKLHSGADANVVSFPRTTKRRNGVS